MKKVAVDGMATPMILKNEAGLLMSCWIWFSRLPAMMEPKNTANHCRSVRQSVSHVWVRLPVMMEAKNTANHCRAGRQAGRWEWCPREWT